MIGQKLFAVIILAAIIVVAGCTAAPGKTYTSNNSGGNQYVPPTNTSEVQQTGAAAQCTQNSDCVDTNPCTTDTCTAGSCKHTAEVDCQVLKESKPKISVADFGSTDKEYVQIDGKNYNLAGWKITNGKGTVYLQFNPNEYRIINGKITIYSGCGSLSTNVMIYQCLDNDFFSSAGDKAILYDENSTIVDQYTR